MFKTYKKDILTFLGIFMVVFLSSSDAFAANEVAAQAKKIIDRLKPLVFIGAAIYLVWVGITALVNGTAGADFAKQIANVALALGVFLIAGAIVNMFVPPSGGVDFLNKAS